MNNPILVEILTDPNDVNSPRIMKVAKSVVSKMDIPVMIREVSLATDEGAHRAQEYELDAAPSILVNGRLAYVGSPSPDEFRKIIQETVKREHSSSAHYF